MSTLNAYFLKHGKAGLRHLAAKTGAKVGYLQQLNYVTRKKPGKKLALKLVEASNGEITLEGLDNPVKVLKRPRTQSPAALDAQLQTLYAKGIGRGELRDFAERAGVSRQALHTRARKLGLARSRVRPWTDEEVALLVRHDDKDPKTLEAIFTAAGFRRTRGAISVRRSIEAAEPTIDAIALHMGVPSDTVDDWIWSGKLKARHGRVKREDLAEFLFTSRDWDQRLCDKAWVVKVLGAGLKERPEKG